VASIFEVQGFGALSEWNGQFSSASAKQAFQKIASLGSNSIELTARIWTQTGTSNTVFADPAKTESDASLLAGFQAAHDAGLSVLFKAALSTLNGTRVSSLAPADVAGFFASYKAEIVHLATIAQAAGVETFAIGNEMSSLSGAPYRDYWVDIIDAIRQVFHGELTYAAATDEASHVSFWDQLDTIGVNTYPPLTASTAPTVQDLIDAWTEVPVNPYYAAAFDDKSPVDFLHSLATKYDKPLLMTEVGYRSVDGTAISPGSWTSSGTADVQEQAVAYNAFFQVWTAHGGDWFKGVELWQWDLNNQYSGTGYSVMGKPAEAIVSQYFHGGGAVPDLAITGSAVADLIDLGRGDDTIDAGLGDDVVHGGAGADIIIGGPAISSKLSVTTVTLVGYGSAVSGVGAQALIKVNGQPVSGLMEFKPAADPSEYQSFTISFANPGLITSIDINLANATPGRALHIKDFLINGVALSPADTANASSPGTFDLYVHNIHADTTSHQDWFSGAATDNDVIDGGAGNDVITGGIGDDVIDGGAGIDTARFTGNIRDYDVTIANGQLVVNDRIAGRDGADHLSDLEFLQFADGVIDTSELFASLANSSGSTLQVLATDGAGKIIGQLLRHADGSDLYSFTTAAGPAPQPPVDSDSFQCIPNAAHRQMDFGGIAQRTATTGNDTFVFSETVRHHAAGDFKSQGSIGHDVSRAASMITIDAAHLPGHAAGHDAVMDSGHDASGVLIDAASMAAHHLLFV
jgi:Ca2+-binding RTX toxin-like protein